MCRKLIGNTWEGLIVYSCDIEKLGGPGDEANKVYKRLIWIQKLSSS